LHLEYDNQSEGDQEGLGKFRRRQPTTWTDEQERLINTRGIVLWKFPAVTGRFLSLLSPPPLPPCNPLRVSLSYCHAKTLIFLRSSLSVLSSGRSSWESERSSFVKNSYYISGNWRWIGRPWRSWKNSQAAVWILWGEIEAAFYRQKRIRLSRMKDRSLEDVYYRVIIDSVKGELFLIYITH